MTDPEIFMRNLAIDSVKRRIAWLRDLSDRLERDEKADITDLNGLRDLAVAFERGLQK